MKTPIDMFGNKREKRVVSMIEQGYKVLAEYKLYEQAKLSGVYVIPSANNILHWFGIIFTRKGIYADSSFRFSMMLPKNFPETKKLPSIVFQYNPMHPLITPTKKFELNQAFPEWQKERTHIVHILAYVQAMILNPFDSLYGYPNGGYPNKQAAQLIMRDPKEYEKRVKAAITKSNKHLFDKPPVSDPHYLIFEEFKPGVHGPILERLSQSVGAGEYKWYDPSTSGWVYT